MRYSCLLLCLAVFWLGCAPIEQGARDPGPGTEQVMVPGQINCTMSTLLGRDFKGSFATEPLFLRGPRLDPDQSFKQPLEEEVRAEVRTKKTKDEPPLSQAEKKALTSKPEILFDLDVKETARMKRFFRYYTQDRRRTFERWLQRAEPYLPYVRKVIAEKGLPHDLVFLPFAESGFNPWAYSRAGAAGLWQFMPATGRHFGLRIDWWLDERRDFRSSTKAAVKYLNELYARFNDWYLALAAYNAGEGTVERALRRSGCNNFYDLAETRHYLKSETRNYVPKFQAILKIVRNLEGLGFEPIDWDAAPDRAQLSIQGGTDLLGLARACSMTWSEFRQANPQFRRRISPPNSAWTVNLPKAELAQAKQYLQSPDARRLAGGQRYKVRPGDSWWRISRRFQVPVQALMRLNNTQSRLLHPGESVLIPVPGQPQGQSAGPGDEYIVRKGDNLWEIARSTGCSLAELRRKNGLQDDLLRVGQRLQLPGGTKRAKTRRIAKRRANYRVQKGDTLWGLARRFEISLNSLLQANGLVKSSGLSVGQGLYIPDRARKTQQARAEDRAAHKRLVRYTVRQGDNIWNIARRFGVSSKELQAWNDLGEKALIHPGDNLQIYVR